jgi:hypothetical protein
MKPIARWVLGVPLLVALLAPPIQAMDYPLSSESIREAYFIGKENLDRRQAFFQPYRHVMPLPKSGPDVHMIEVETPFALLVDAMARSPITYHAPDAVQDYLDEPAPFRVHVEIYLTATYPAPTDTPASMHNFWKTFQIHLTQDAEIQPRSVNGALIPDISEKSIVGATVDADYDGGKIDGSEPVTVDVDTPDGQKVETTFAIRDLR